MAKPTDFLFYSFLLIGKMSNVVEEHQTTETIQPPSIVIQPISTVTTDEPVAGGTSSLVQSLLQEQPDESGEKKKKKKKKAKTGRLKELVRHSNRRFFSLTSFSFFLGSFNQSNKNDFCFTRKIKRSV